jgi:hypothetical protein
MNVTANMSPRNSGFELYFRSLFNEGRGLAFPCDPAGRVDAGALPERARHNYLRATTLVGREFTTPSLRVYA